MVYIRAAQAHDAPLIKKMVSDEQLDPTAIKWQRFLIAEVDGQIAGIGQVRKHRDCEELGSLIVLKAYRGQGIAAQLIEQLEARAGRPLYLDCRDRMIPYYERFGYKVIRYWDTPLTLRLKLLFPMMFRVFGIRVVSMRKD
ncbi:MAG: GNAT family N-acetyltransferase [Anaerolineae bacterium]